MSLLRLLRQIAPFSARRVVAGAAAFAAGLFAAGAFSSAVPAAPQDVCLPVVGCVTTTVPTVTVPTVTPPTLPTTTSTATTTAGTTTTAGPGGTPAGSPTSAGTTTTTTTTDATATPGARLTVRIVVRVRGHGPKRAIELRLRLNKPARVSALLSRKGRALERNQFTARAGSNVWRLRLRGTVKPGAAQLGLTYRASTGETARSTHRLRLPR